MFFSLLSLSFVLFHPFLNLKVLVWFSFNDMWFSNKDEIGCFTILVEICNSWRWRKIISRPSSFFWKITLSLLHSYDFLSEAYWLVYFNTSSHCHRPCHVTCWSWGWSSSYWRMESVFCCGWILFLMESLQYSAWIDEEKEFHQIKR